MLFHLVDSLSLDKEYLKTSKTASAYDSRPEVLSSLVLVRWIIVLVKTEGSFPGFCFL